MALKIARRSEVDLLHISGGKVEVGTDLMNCYDDLSIFDNNGDHLISTTEIFRDEVLFCCQDIGREINIVVRVYDQFNNYKDSEVSVKVNTKGDWVACDDNDPCTENDRQYGSCPCAGSPIIEDIDLDNIIDCNDPLFTMCLAGTTVEVFPEELQEYLDQGAIGGPCQDEMGPSIAGYVATIERQMIQEVQIKKNVSNEEMTDEGGVYHFEDNEINQRYELTAYKNDDASNGVSTLDLVLLREYILGLREIDDPYILIAADVNRDGKISGFDLVEIQRLIIGRAATFSNNTSWRFVIEEFEFDDIRNPWTFDEVNVINRLSSDQMEENWIGVKIGDINLSARVNNKKGKTRSKTFSALTIPNFKVKKGEKITVPIQLAEGIGVRGVQLGFTLKDVAFQSISATQIDIDYSNYRIYKEVEDHLNFVWASESLEENVSELLQLELLVEEDGYLEDMISLSQEGFEHLLTTSDYKENQAELRFTEEVILFESDIASLYQNQPNPFNGETIVQFYLPEAGEVGLQFYNDRGQLLWTRKSEYHEGINAIRLTRADLSNFTGVVFYQMRYKGQTFSRKMVLSE